MDTAALREKARKYRRLAKAVTDERMIETLTRMADECDALLASEGEHVAAGYDPINGRGAIAADQPERSRPRT